MPAPTTASKSPECQPVRGNPSPFKTETTKIQLRDSGQINPWRQKLKPTKLATKPLFDVHFYYLSGFS